MIPVGLTSPTACCEAVLMQGSNEWDRKTAEPALQWSVACIRWRASDLSLHSPSCDSSPSALLCLVPRRLACLASCTQGGTGRGRTFCASASSASLHKQQPIQDPTRYHYLPHHCPRAPAAPRHSAFLDTPTKCTVVLRPRTNYSHTVPLLTAEKWQRPIYLRRVLGSAWLPG